MSLAGQACPAPVVKPTRSNPRVTDCASWRADSRPSKRAKAMVWLTPGQRRLTSRRATSAVAPRSRPRSTSTHTRAAPCPPCNSVGRSRCRRIAFTSAWGSSAYTSPTHCRQSERLMNSPWRKRPLRLARWPHSGGGVASKRKSCRRRPLRNTKSTSCSTRAGAPRNSSTHRTCPRRMANSPWAKSQSRACWVPSMGSGVSSSRLIPPTRIRPAGSRRTSSAASSISSCSNRSSKLSSDCRDKAADTRGRRSAVRP